MSYKHTHVYTQVAKLREACYRNHMKIRPHSPLNKSFYILSLKCAHLVAMRSEKLIIKTIMKAVAFENLNQFVANTSHILRKKFRSYGLASSRIIWPVSLRIMHACMHISRQLCNSRKYAHAPPLTACNSAQKSGRIFARLW